MGYLNKCGGHKLHFHYLITTFGLRDASIQH